MLKRCSKCKRLKTLLEFSKASKEKDGLRYSCKACDIAYVRANLDREKERSQRWQLENADRYKARLKKWQNNNKDKALAHGRNWRRNNRAKANESYSRKRATKIKATPAWANLDRIRQIYELAENMKKVGGEDLQVDHVVPLQSKIVCGLHCEANLRIISSNENQSKGNRHWPDMP